MADQLSVPVLSASRIREELFRGGFRPLSETDWYAYSGAEEGSLIANVKVGRYEYDVLFTPSMGNVQVFYYEEADQLCWEIDLLTDSVIDL
jgi:hypothetical protein